MLSYTTADGRTIRPIWVLVGCALMWAGLTVLAAPWDSLAYWLGLPMTVIVAVPLLTDWLVTWRLAGPAPDAPRTNAEAPPGVLEPEHDVDDPEAEPPPQTAQELIAQQVRLTRVRAVLHAAREVNGVNGTVIPRWSDLDGVTRHRWTKATDDLERAGYVRKDDREGTYLPAHTLGELYALTCRPDFDLTPLPRYGGAVNPGRTEQRTGFSGRTESE